MSCQRGWFQIVSVHNWPTFDAREAGVWAGPIPSCAERKLLFHGRMAALPAGAIGTGLFHLPALRLGSRELVKTMPSGRTQKTSTAPGCDETAATPLRGSALPGAGAIGMGLFHLPALKRGAGGL